MDAKVRKGLMMSEVKNRVEELFDLSGHVAIITGGAGLLGYHHGAILAAAGAHVVLLDLEVAQPAMRAQQLSDAHRVECVGLVVDITDEASIVAAKDAVVAKFGRVDILINNAANNPKVEDQRPGQPWSRLENFPIETWNGDIAVGLTGAFLCSRVFGQEMVKRGKGVILNIASDLAVIAPDQRLYRKDGVAEDKQPVKPVTYSVVKTALLGLTRYLSTYWVASGVRVNAISPGGVANGQPEEFTAKLHALIPMGRMAEKDEYQGAVLFLCSDASSYMTGQNLIVDGGRSVL
jgi:NAD(P)-dependent dehydrogenase (short-subunit alcohol dehydrogenase family)